MQNHSKPSRTPLPTALPPLKELDLHARYYSSRTGGDFFDAVAAGPHVVFLLTDIAGTRSDAQAIAAAAQDTFRLCVPELFTAEVINMMDTLSTLAHEINRAIYEASGASRPPSLAATTSPSACSPTSTPAASPPSFATAMAPAFSDMSPCHSASSP